MSDIEFTGTWHLLSEKLPEHPCSVLIAFNSGNVLEASYSNYSRQPSFSWYPDIYVISEEPARFDGAYWCYVPESPAVKK